MSWLNRLWKSLSSRRLNDELQEEFDCHLAMLEDEARGGGLSERDARAEARKRFGSQSGHLDRTREADVSVWVSDMIQDLRFAFRQIRKQRGFTAVSVVVIALGISAVTTVFSLVDAVLVHSLPYQDPERLVYIWTPNRQFGESVPQELGPNYPDVLDWEKSSHSFTALAMLNQQVFNVFQTGNVSRVGGAIVSETFFRTLAVQPELGRAIATDDTGAGRDRVAVISHRLWVRLFAEQPNVLGKALQLNRDKYVVIGVMPQEFGYPFEGDVPYATPGYGRTDVWIPMALSNAARTDRKNPRSTDAVIARLHSSITARQAGIELAAIERRLNPLYPAELQGWTVLVKSLAATILGPVESMLWILMTAVGVVLLIACANVSSLSLARATARAEEVTIRMSLGAGRFRLVRQMLTESIVVAFLGSVLGVLLSCGAVPIVLRLNPGNIPRFEQAAINLPVLFLAASLAILTGILTGLAPALFASQLNLRDALSKGGNKGSMRGSSRLGQGLILAEVALSFVLLAAATLLIRSYVKLDAQDPGYLRSTLTMNLQLDGRYSKPEQRRALFTSFLQRLRQIPGVVEAGAGSDIPLDHSESLSIVEVKGFGRPKNMIDGRTVTPGYLRAFGTPLLAGRSFEDQDAQQAARVAIVNHAFVRAFMGGRDPLAVQIRIGSNLESRPWARVIGVIGDRRHSALEETPRPEYFQLYAPPYDTGDLHFAARSVLPASRLAATAQRLLRGLDPNLALDDVRTMEGRMSEANARRRFQTILLSSFGAVALVLALAGIYGVLSYSVRQRTKEMGLRMAIGANRSNIFLMVLRQGLSAVVLGLAVGSVLALFLTRAIGGWLFGVPPNDLLTFALTPLLVLLVSSLACLVPAREAVGVDPAVAMRGE